MSLCRRGFNTSRSRITATEAGTTAPKNANRRSKSGERIMGNTAFCPNRETLLYHYYSTPLNFISTPYLNLTMTPVGNPHSRAIPA